MYPKLEISIPGIVENYKAIKSLCDERNIKLSVVTKLLSGREEIVKELVKNGVKCICESKIKNLIKYSRTRSRKMVNQIADDF